MKNFKWAWIPAFAGTTIFFLGIDALAAKKKEKAPEKSFEEMMMEDLKGQNSDLDTKPHAVGKVQGLFQEAAKEFGIKTDILLAISMHETGFDMKKGKEKNPGWGYMNLGGKNSPGSFKQAVALLKEEPKKIGTDGLTNIRGGAAVFRECLVKTLGKKKAKDARLKDMHPALKCYASTGDKFNDQLFADEIFSVLQAGYTHNMADGESVVIEAQEDLTDFEPAPLKF